MADDARVTYVIRVISEGGEEKEAKSGEAGSRADAAGGKKKKTFREMDAMEKVKFVAKAAPVGYALKMADNVISNEINRVELRTGNAILQQKIEHTKSVATRMVATVGMLAVGVATMNPVLILGAATSVIDDVVSSYQRRETMNIERSLESVSIGMANIRAGANGSRGRKDQI